MESAARTVAHMPPLLVDNLVSPRHIVFLVRRRVHAPRYSYDADELTATCTCIELCAYVFEDVDHAGSCKYWDSHSISPILSEMYTAVNRYCSIAPTAAQVSCSSIVFLA
jgi:hypothetical protein